ncbi:hypothetical protein THAOC_21505 [Thalassiosira oceanica]|uniref:Uncharacterized protein n=1 Tax=Thalassiosira oceanica TaxID=159749 RepID=K0RZ99_THAOC|nr:hypothetical protein THAOC_21505 [Thalassiosira oceanica]|eukprot:EJK58380.1 hypothetical protein THAOC_21505 [Thalassiosira oceanica]
MRPPRIELRANPWKGFMLPLHHGRDTRAVFGATTGSIMLGRVPSTRRRVHWVGPWPPSTSNNHRCTDTADNHRSVCSDVRARLMCD